MVNIEVLAIEGLDAAIIGTTVINGREVLAYNYDVAVAIIAAAGHTEEYAAEWVAEMSSRDVDGAPAFIYVDKNQEIYGPKPEPGTIVH